MVVLSGQILVTPPIFRIFLVIYLTIFLGEAGELIGSRDHLRDVI